VGRGGRLVAGARDGRRWGWRVIGLPDGVVTFWFSDIEGSTRLVKALREQAH
jgi:class 3 adenylate cyclase